MTSRQLPRQLPGTASQAAAWQLIRHAWQLHLQLMSSFLASSGAAFWQLPDSFQAAARQLPGQPPQQAHITPSLAGSFSTSSFPRVHVVIEMHGLQPGKVLASLRAADSWLAPLCLLATHRWCWLATNPLPPLLTAVVAADCTVCDCAVGDVCAGDDCLAVCAAAALDLLAEGMLWGLESWTLGVCRFTPWELRAWS